MAKLNEIILKALWFLSTNGVDPRQTSIIAAILKYVALICNIGVVIIASLELFLNWNGISTVAKLETLPNSCLCLSKLLCLIYYKKDFLEIIKSIKDFWELENVQASCQAKILKYNNFTFIFYKYFTRLSMGTVISLCMKPLLVGQRILQFPGYDVCDLKTTPCFEFQYIFQIYHIGYQLYLTMMGFDGLFIALVTYAYSELEMIKSEFSVVFGKDLPGNQINERFSKLVRHHEFVLRFIKKLNHVLSGICFIQYWMTLVSVTFNLFMMTNDGFPPSAGEIIKYAPYIVTVISQLGFYCTAGAYLATQAVSVADAAWDNEWYCKTDPKLRKSLMFVIERSQKGQRLTVGKLYTLDLVTYNQVLRHVVSIYTLLNNLKSK